MRWLRFARALSLPGLILLAVSAVPFAAAAQSIDFLGQKYEKKFEGGNPADGSRFAEFGLPPEPIKQWTRLVTYRSFPKAEADPVKAANRLGANVTARDKGARQAIIRNDKTGEVIIDFLTAVKDDLMEFNVFKYTKAPKGGLIATQFALRFRLGEISSEEMRKIRTGAVQEMAKYDSTKAVEFFGLK